MVGDRGGSVRAAFTSRPFSVWVMFPVAMSTCACPMRGVDTNCPHACLNGFVDLSKLLYRTRNERGHRIQINQVAERGKSSHDEKDILYSTQVPIE